MIQITNSEIILEIWAFEVHIDREDLEYVLCKEYSHDLTGYIDREYDEDGFHTDTVRLIEIPLQLLIDTIEIAIIYSDLKYTTNTKKL